MRKTTFLLPILVIAVIGILSSIFVVDEREKALVLQFGQIKSVKEEPGLSFKIPLIQEVVRYDDRILSLDTETIEVTPSDDRRLVVDAFARYRIADVVQFRQAVGVGGLVEEGSVKKSGGAITLFRVTDLKTTVAVSYKGLLPDLFREGQGVVAEGRHGAVADLLDRQLRQRRLFRRFGDDRIAADQRQRRVPAPGFSGRPRKVLSPPNRR